MKRALVVTCVFALGASGCSFAFAGGPPANHRELKYFDCTSSHSPPVIDTVAAVAGGAFTLLAWGIGAGLAADSGGNPNNILYAGIPLTLLPAASAIYGYWKVGDCRDAKAELVTRIYASPLAAPPASSPLPGAPAPLSHDVPE